MRVFFSLLVYERIKIKPFSVVVLNISVPGRDATMGSLINSNFRVRPSSKFAHTVDRVKEYHNYIDYLALSISRVL